MMTQGTRDLLEAAAEAGVRRFVLMSALGTTEETKDLVPYYGAKWEMEQIVKASGLEHVIFRPSFVFGPEGGALGQFKQDREARAGDADRRVREPADPADLGRRRRRVLRGRRSRSRRPRTGRSSSAAPTWSTWNEFWSRLKQHPRPGGRRAHADGAHARAGGRARAAAEPAGDPRPAEDARGRRQRRSNSDAVDDFGAPARPAGRAAAARRDDSDPENGGEGRPAAALSTRLPASK